ncbi:MAG: Jag N-terminal domain-containing protein [Chloroflexi bacterium]|nr:Jag N-terminal domain-containing protein [Chloroflexota bacterium]
MADQVETAARTVEEAVKLALLKLDATLDEVDIKIMDSGTPGKLLGLGAREARILVTRRTSPFVGDEVEADLEPAPDTVEAPPPRRQAPLPRTPAPPPVYLDEPEPIEETEPVEAENLAEITGELIQGLVDRMGFDASVETTSEDPLSFNIYSEDDHELESLIGPRGENLRAFGFLLNSMLGRMARRGVRVFIDVNGYRKEREDELGELARHTAETVNETHEPITLEAMPAHERRLVHIALADHEGVRTYSVGQGKERRVVIGPEG